jgi:hypothetical protein
LTSKEKIIKWVKRLGVAGILLFLIKGLLWLLVPAIIAFYSQK